MKYIRTVDGIYELNESQQTFLQKRMPENPEFACLVFNDSDTVFKKDIVKEASIIEELFMSGDLVIVVDYKGNVKPLLVNKVSWLKKWLTTNDWWKVKEWYIKRGNDYVLVAKMNDKGVLELI